MKCRLCNNTFHLGLVDTGDQICEGCRESHALAPPSPGLRPRVPCQRCRHTEFVRVRALRERATTAGEYGKQYMAPLALTFKLSFGGRRLGANRPFHEVDPQSPAGLLEAYACRKCGFTELYARQPVEIPIGPEYGTELFSVETGDESPYR